MTCLNSNGAINSYVVSTNQPWLGDLTCDGGNPAEYGWACMRELTSGNSKYSIAAAASAAADATLPAIPTASTDDAVAAAAAAAANATSTSWQAQPQTSSTNKTPFKAPRTQRLPLYELGFTNMPAMPVLYPARFLPDTAML
jgi:hypothetical protein